MKKYLLIALSLMLVTFLVADVQISTRFLSMKFLFDINFGYSRCASLYNASEINAAGTITHLGWDVRDPQDHNIPAKVYITTTTASSITQSTWEDMKGGLVPVFDGTLRFDSTDWNQVDITDFYYDSATDGNLLILTEANYGGGGVADYPTFWGSWLQGLDCMQMWSSDNEPPTGDGMVVQYRPDIRFYGIGGATPPEPVTLNSPADGATGVNILTTLTWTDGEGSPTGYDLYFGEEWPEEGNFILSHETLNVRYWSPEILNYGTTYYWKVVPWNENGHPEFELCETRSFTTMNDTSLPMPYFQDFESANSLADINWTGSFRVGSGYGVNDSKAMYYNLFGGINSTYATTHTIGPMQPDAELKFDYRFIDYNETTATVLEENEGLEIHISTDFGETFQTIYEINNTNHNATTSFLPARVSLAGYDSGYIMLRFWGKTHYFSGNDFFLSIDNVSVQETPNIPVFSYTPESIDFGYVQAGQQSSPQSVTVTNSGGGSIDLNTSNISIIGANPDAFNYYPSSLPVSLGAGESVNIVLYGIPAQEGNYSATFRITFDGVNYDTALNVRATEPGTVIIGTGTQNNDIPIDAWSGYSYSQMIYLANEINFNTPGYQIEKLAFYWNGAGVGTNSGGWTVYMANTYTNSFASNSSWISLNQLTQVYQGQVPIPATSGWIEITLDEPFMYNGNANLVIAVDENTPGYDGSNRYFHSSPSSANRSIVFSHDSTNPDPAAPPTSGVVSRKSAIANLRLKFEMAPTEPILSISEDSWDFGENIIRSVNTKNITLRNVGIGTLQVSNISIAGDYFSISQNPAPVGLDWGEIATITVKYTPTAVGEHTGTLTITDGRAVTTVELSGSCFDPTISEFPHLENFDGNWVGTPPAPQDWTVINANNDSYTWRRGNTYISPTHSTPYAALGSGNTNDWLISPPLDLTDKNVRLSWWDRVEGASQPSSYRVYVSTTSNAIGDFTELLTDVTCSNTAWTEHELNLSQFNGEIVFVAFHQYASYSSSWGFGIDDFYLEEIPNYPIFAYSPEEINFGTISYGIESDFRYVTISNDGGAPFSITEDDFSLIGANADDFSYGIGGLPATLQPGNNLQIPVTVNSQAGGWIYATLRMNYDDEDYDVELSAYVLPEGTVVIGGEEINLNMPVHPYYGYTYSQSIYKQGEIRTEGKQIQSIAYYWNGAGVGTNSSQWTVYMAHTELENFASTTGWMPVSEMTEVFSGSLDIPAAAGWIVVDLDTPFPYNNIDNLVIAVDENRPSYDGSSQFFFSTTDAGNRSIRYFNDGTNPDPANPPTGTLVAGFPNLMMMFADMPTTPVLGYNPDSISFGIYFQNESSDWKTVTIRNIGSGTLELSADDIEIIGDTAAMFELDLANLPASLATGVAETFAVRFTPTSEGIINATLRMNYAGLEYDIALSGRGYPEGTVIIGDGTVNLQMPVAPYYGYTYSQSIYKQEDLDTHAKQIESIAYYWNGAGVGTNSSDWTIYMGHTQREVFANTTDWVPLGEMMEVFTGELVIPDTPGWIIVDLDVPFPYNNEENLVIAVDENRQGYDGNAQYFYSTSVAGVNRSLRYYNDSTNPDPATPPTGTLAAGFPNLMVMFGNLPTEPIFSYTPQSLNYGTQYQNEAPVWKNVTLRNNGSGSLEFGVNDIEILGDDAAMFELDTSNLPAVLGSMESVNIGVGFSPTRDGEISATLRLYYGGEDFDIALSGAGYPAGTVIIGDGTSPQRFPFGTLYGYERSASLFTAEELGTTGTISYLAWDAVTTNAVQVPFKIYAGITTESELSEQTYANLAANLTLVKEGEHMFGEIGWNGFFLDTPFEYTGGNLIIAVETNYGGGGTSPSANFAYTSAGNTNRHMQWAKDSTPPDTNGTRNANRPNLMLSIASDGTALDSPVLNIQKSLDAIYLSWEAVPNATMYYIYTADSPDGDWTLIHSTSSTSHTVAETADRAFFKVIASDASIRK